ncbi:Hypothetical protein NTJ_15362 [Nesidiocoris tenuis]|uniref:Uncharacterized protein n=1 Tax=Nesidiocoris tenuis TaxID=355587 RepID=A0ABN7BE05_9HEMI|nr:Hypothetical protein NTJ_15362 [Nesidiocoris tenuis]
MMRTKQTLRTMRAERTRELIGRYALDGLMGLTGRAQCTVLIGRCAMTGLIDLNGRCASDWLITSLWDDAHRTGSWDDALWTDSQAL